MATRGDGTQEVLDSAKAKLTIVSRALSPEEISDHVGLQWDDARRIGDPKGRSGRVWGENIWWLYETWKGHQNGMPIDRALEECIERLRGRVGSFAPRIRSLPGVEHVEFGLYMLSQTIPPVHLSLGTLTFINELGAELDVDIVLYGDDSASRRYAPP
jgi:hypothetical protein